MSKKRTEDYLSIGGRGGGIISLQWRNRYGGR